MLFGGDYSVPKREFLMCGDELMDDQFRLEAEEPQKVADGLRDIESRMQTIVSTLRVQLAAEGIPWQFSGAPAGIPTNLKNLQNSVDPSVQKSVGAAVANLADHLDTVVKTVSRPDR
jgi:hypothetical protein